MLGWYKLGFLKIKNVSESLGFPQDWSQRACARGGLGGVSGIGWMEEHEHQKGEDVWMVAHGVFIS